MPRAKRKPTRRAEGAAGAADDAPVVVEEIAPKPARKRKRKAVKATGVLPHEQVLKLLEVSGPGYPGVLLDKFSVSWKDGTEHQFYDRDLFTVVHLQWELEFQKETRPEDCPPEMGEDDDYALEFRWHAMNVNQKAKKPAHRLDSLVCYVFDRKRGVHDKCSCNELMGNRDEIGNLFEALSGWEGGMRGYSNFTTAAPFLQIDQLRLYQYDQTRKKLKFALCLPEEAFQHYSPLNAYDPPTNRMRWDRPLKVLMKLRPDWFPEWTQRGTELAADEETNLLERSQAMPSGDHLELAMHTVGQGSEQINTALLYAAIAPPASHENRTKDGGETSKSAENSETLDLDKIPGLVPTLRSYQKRAVRWMVQREACFGERESESLVWREGLEGGPWTGEHPSTGLHMMFGYKEIYVNQYTGMISSAPYPGLLKVPGGILADEMGLGKTVELLACILLNRQPQVEQTLNGRAAPFGGLKEEEGAKSASSEGFPSTSKGYAWCSDCESRVALSETGCKTFAELPQTYICGECARNRAKDASLLRTQSKTTLIICPDPILEQWQEELSRHSHGGFLSVFTYSGQKQSLSTGGSPDEIVTARTLSQYDVVLSTYSVLGTDIHRDADIEDALEENQKSLRFAKRYQKIPTPLTRLKWWRVCLDEAQMVNSGTAKCAQMALKLQTKYRWCVTGTPINRGLEDLYGLLLFLQAHPFDYKWWWKCLVLSLIESEDPHPTRTRKGFANLTRLLQPSSGGIMWRTRKVDVKEDLDLRPQLVKVTNLRLSAIEMHFYKQQHQECYDVAMAALPRGTVLSSLETSEEEDQTLGPRAAKRIFAKLLRLRQACCHPQVGSQGIRSLSQTAKPLSMDEILDMLIAKAKVDAEDELRILIFCLNGLASIFQLEKKRKDAVGAYREAMQRFGTHDTKYGIKTDTLQKLHTLHNLSLLLSEDNSGLGIAPTLRDSNLAKEAEDLKRDYLKNTSSGLILANSDFLSKKRKVAYKEEDKVGSNWWVELLYQIEQDGEAASHLVRQIKSRLNDRTAVGTSMQGRNSTSLVHRFSNIGGLKYLMSVELGNIFDARDEALAELLRLEGECKRESPGFVYEVSHCGKCRGELGTSLYQCAYCKLDDILMRYEARIFSLRTQATRKGAILSAEDATRAQEAAGGHAGGWGRMAGRTFQEDSGKKKGRGQGALDDLGRGARGRGDKAVAHADVFHAPSESEVILDYLASIGSKGAFRGLSLSLSADFESLMKNHLELLENMRAEFKPARAYAQAQRQYVYSFDELDMAMMKMQLRAEGEELVHDFEKYFKLTPTEVVVRNKELSDEKIIAQADLNRAVGTLRYLEGLASTRRRAQSGEARATNGASQGAKGDEEEETMCLVCQENIEGDTAVLSCGHLFCSKCVDALIARAKPPGSLRRTKADAASRKILCPTCRTAIPVSDIAYAGVCVPDGQAPAPAGEAEGDSEFDSEEVRVRGSFGSKLEAVVRRVASILTKDASSKILVFSEWQDVLEVLTHAFKANHVRFVFAKGKPAMTKSLKAFKTREISVLMLPVKLGANGLNLIEAQHVILIEPLLDPAKEAQAFGRVDRIGQTRTTYVHRFHMSDTVEEKVYLLAQQRARMYSVMGTMHRRKEGVGEMQQLTVRDVKQLLAFSNQKDAPQQGGRQQR